MNTTISFHSQGKFAKALGRHPFLLLVFIVTIPAIVYIVAGLLGSIKF